MAGILFVIATPIGNLEDISDRARKLLGQVGTVLAEDTRHSGLLLSRLGIKAKLLSYHDHNERERTPELIKLLAAGEDLALISDAGTPCISDPGYRIVRACHEAGIKVSAVPGPSSLVAALSISGLPSDRFTFEGFLPPKGAKRERRVEQILAATCTSIVFESTHKIGRLMGELAAKAPEREVVIVREISKVYEELLRGSAAQLNKQVIERAGLKGEIVVLVAADKRDPSQKNFEDSDHEIEEEEVE